MQTNIVQLHPGKGALDISSIYCLKTDSNEEIDRLSLDIPIPWLAAYHKLVQEDAPGIKIDAFLSEMEFALLLLEHPYLVPEADDIPYLSKGIYFNDEMSFLACDWVLKNHGNTSLEAWATMLASRFDFVWTDEYGRVSPVPAETAIRDIVSSVKLAFTGFSGTVATHGFSPEDAMDYLLDEMDAHYRRLETPRTTEEEEELEELFCIHMIGQKRYREFRAEGARQEAKSELAMALDARDVARDALGRYEAWASAEDLLPSWYMQQKRRLVVDLAKAELSLDDYREALRKIGGRLLSAVSA